jgi:hypothetical protein
VIEPDDAREIFFHTEADEELRFFCGDAGAKRASLYRSPGRVIVSQDD